MNSHSRGTSAGTDRVATFVAFAFSVAAVLWLGICEAAADDASPSSPTQSPAATPSDSPASESSAPEDEKDYDDLLYFAEDRLIILRVHVRIDGKSFAQVWDDSIDKFFAGLDQDGDGVLSGDELKRLPNPTEMAQMGLVSQPRSSMPYVMQVDAAPQDGKVTREELGAYLRRNGSGPIATQISRPMQTVRTGSGIRSQQPGQGAGIFQKLDIDGDGKLSEAELESAAAMLRKLDWDDDETVSLLELQSDRSYSVIRQVEDVVASTSTSFFTSTSTGGSLTKLGSELIERYDHKTQDGSSDRSGKDNKLSWAELGLPESSFAPFDVDGDGALDFDELGRFLAAPVPTAELVVRLGKKGAGEKTVELVATEAGFATNVRESPGGLATMLFAGIQLEIFADSAWTAANLKQVAQAQFANADADQNKYLELKEVERNPYFRQSFNLMDRDGDGKVFEEELLAFLEQQQILAGARTVLTVTDQGKNLFAILDLNRDQRLGLRELMTIGERLAPWDTDGDGSVSVDELPANYRMTIGRGRPGGYYGGGVVVTSDGRVMQSTTPTSQGGPRWFQKMDRNRDGDLSPREFLGTSEQFQNLDADGDGLIDAIEAAAIE